MLKDPTEFRKRFAAYKNGKMPYENGLPKYEDGKPKRVNWSYWDNKKSTDYVIPFEEEKAIKLTNAGLATGAVLSTNLLDSIADNADRAGLRLQTALGLATKESTLGNPTDDKSAWKISSGIRLQFNGNYPGTQQHINNGRDVPELRLVNYHKGDIDPTVFSFGDKHGGLSILLTAFEFFKNHPDKYNPGQKNYQKLVNKRGEEVMLSPEIQKWATERVVKKLAPRFTLQNPLLNESKFNVKKFRDGKLPGYAIGTPDNEEVSDATYVLRPMIMRPIKRNFIAEAQKRHAAEAVGPDIRSSYQRKQSQAEKLYANQQYQKAKDDVKRAEGLELMMKTISPSTYIEASTGLDLGAAGRFVTDAAVFGLPSMLKRGISKALSIPVFGKKVGQNLSEINPFKYNGSDTKDLLTKMKSFLIRQALSQTVSKGKDLAKDPYGIMDLSSDVVHYEGMPAGVEDVFRYLILPRTNINPLNYDNTINMLSRYGYNVLDDYNWAKYVDDNLAGYLDNSTYGIALRDKYIDYAAAHEFRHRMQRLIKDKPSLLIDRKSYLDRAYDDDFVNLPKNVSQDDSLYGYTLMEDEKATTNLDARRWAFKNLSDNPNIGKASIKEQNEFLDNLTDDLIIEAVVNSNGYGKRYIHFLELKYHLLDNPKLNARYADRFRNAMKYYGVSAVPITMALTNTRNELRNK